MKFKKDELYSVTEMSDGEFHSAYDGFYAVVDGKMEALSMWEDELANELMTEEGLIEDEAYKEAREDIRNNIWIAYEGAKDIALFQGVAPGKVFDFYSTFKCLEVL